MKLVDILARELRVWPEEWGIYCVSSKVEGSFAAWFGYRNPVYVDGGWSDIGTVELWTSEEPEDRKSVVVRRFEWQAAVDALKAVENAVPEWNGEGPPPVGVRIEAKHKNAQPNWARPGFYETKIIAMGKQLVIFEEDGNGHEKVGTLSDYIFRPIRTPEQIAEDQRLQEIADALTATSKAVDQWNVDINCSSAIRATVEAMIDAGYRKFEIVDN